MSYQNVQAMDTDRIRKYANDNLSEKRLRHTLGVCDQAIKLAEIYDADATKAEIAALCHDLFRGKTQDELNSLVTKYELGDRYLNNPNLSHGKIAACFVQEKLGIDDREIIDAISYHTTGRSDMGLLEKIVFIADAIEPGRDYPGVDDIRDRAYRDIDEACLMSLEGTVSHLKSQGVDEDQIDKDTLEAIDFIKKEKN